MTQTPSLLRIEATSPGRNRDRRSVRLPNLHANDGIDEEEHGDEQAHVWQSLPEKMKREELFERAVMCTVTICASVNG